MGLPAEGSLYAAMIGGVEGARLGQLLEGYLPAQVAGVMARLGVPDLLDGKAQTAPELAEAAGAQPSALARVLAAAAVYGLVTKDEDGRFALTSIGELLGTDVDRSARSYAIGFLGPPLWESAGRLIDTVRNTRSEGGASSQALWEFYSGHPEEAVWFARAMGTVTSILVSRLAAAGYTPPQATHRRRRNGSWTWAAAGARSSPIS